MDFQPLLEALLDNNKELALKKVNELCSSDIKKNVIISNLVTFYCDTSIYGQQNIFILNLFLKNTDQAISVANKKGINNYNAFQKYVHILIDILCRANPRNVWEQPEPFDISTIEALVENYGNKRHEELTFLINDGKISKDLYKILNILYYKVRYQEKKDVIGIVSWLVNIKSINIAEINYDEISKIKGTSDIIWYLWKLALLFAEFRLKVEQVNRFVKLNLHLFTLFYQKQKRTQKLQILFYVFSVLSSQNCMKYILEDEIEINEEEYIKYENDTNDEKKVDLSYLKFYTEFNSELSHQVAIEKQQMRKSNDASCVK